MSMTAWPKAVIRSRVKVGISSTVRSSSGVNVITTLGVVTIVAEDGCQGERPRASQVGPTGVTFNHSLTRGPAPWWQARCGGGASVSLCAHRSHGVFDARVANGSVLIGDQTGARGLQDLPAPAFTQLEDIHTGAESLGFDLLRVQQPLQRGGGGRSGFSALAQEVGPSPQPLKVLIVRRAVGPVSHVRSPLSSAGVGGYHRPASEDIKPGADDTHVHVSAHQCVRHGVLDRIELDVPVTVDLRPPPGHLLPPLGGQGRQLRGFVFLKPNRPGTLPTSEGGAVIDPLDAFTNRLVELI